MLCADLLFGLLYIILFKPTKGRKIFNFFIFSFLIFSVGKGKNDEFGFSILSVGKDKFDKLGFVFFILIVVKGKFVVKIYTIKSYKTMTHRCRGHH